MLRIEEILVPAAMVLYLLALLSYVLRFATRWTQAGTVATGAAWLGVAAQTAMMVARGLAAGRVPLVSMYEYLVAFSWMVALAYWVFEARAGKAREDVRAAGAPALLLAVALLGYATTLPVESKQAEALMPVLKSNWLIFHVSCAVIAYGAAGLASALALLYFLRLILNSERTTHRTGVLLVVLLFSATELANLLGLIYPHAQLPSWAIWGARAVYIALAMIVFGLHRQLPGALRNWLQPRLPSEGALDRSVYRAVRFAFPFLTLVNVTGAVWAYNAWGRYWGWDPKETWSLITWMIYVFYLHARLRANWRPPQTNAVVVVGIVAILFTFLGVNQLAQFSSSLHSYASGAKGGM